MCPTCGRGGSTADDTRSFKAETEGTSEGQPCMTESYIDIFNANMLQEKHIATNHSLLSFHI